MFPVAVIPSPSSAQTPFTAHPMHTQTEFGVGHPQSVEVVGFFLFFIAVPVPFSGIGVGRMDFVSREEGKKVLWCKVWCSSSGDRISMVDIDGLWHRMGLKLKLKLAKYPCEGLVGRSDKAKVKEQGDNESCRKNCAKGKDVRAGLGIVKRKNQFPKNSHYESAGINVFTKFLQNNLGKLADRKRMLWLVQCFIYECFQALFPFVNKCFCLQMFPLTNVYVNKCFASFSGQM